MNSLLFGLIFFQTSIVFIAGVILTTIFYKGILKRDEKVRASYPVSRIRSRHSHINRI